LVVRVNEVIRNMKSTFEMRIGSHLKLLGKRNLLGLGPIRSKSTSFQRRLGLQPVL
jgi:hypothetical protein